MKEKVLATLAELGFIVNPMDEFRYGFEYEGRFLIYLSNDEDQDFLVLCMPDIYDSEDGDEAVFLELINEINATVKYVKAYGMGGRIWLFYERELVGNDDLEELLTRMILRLDIALAQSHMAIAKTRKKTGEGTEAIVEDVSEDNDNE